MERRNSPDGRSGQGGQQDSGKKDDKKPSGLNRFFNNQPDQSGAGKENAGNPLSNAIGKARDAISGSPAGGILGKVGSIIPGQKKEDSSPPRPSQPVMPGGVNQNRPQSSGISPQGARDPLGSSQTPQTSAPSPGSGSQSFSSRPGAPSSTSYSPGSRTDDDQNDRSPYSPQSGPRQQGSTGSLSSSSTTSGFNRQQSGSTGSLTSGGAQPGTPSTGQLGYKPGSQTGSPAVGYDQTRQDSQRQMPNAGGIGTQTQGAPTRSGSPPSAFPPRSSVSSATTPADEPKRGLFSGLGGKKDDDQSQKPVAMPGGVQGTPTQTQKKTGGRQRTQSDELMTLDTKLDILGGVLIVTALIILLSFFSQTPGSLTRQLLRGLYQGFGWGAYFVPVVLGAIGVWLLWDHFGDQLPEVQPIRILGVTIVYLSVLTLMHAVLVAVQPVGYVYVDPALSNPAYPGFTPELMWQNAAACPARPQEYLDRGWILQQAYLDSYQIAQCGYGGGYLGAWIQTSISGLLGALPLFLIMLVTLFGGTLMMLKMPLDVALNKIGDRFRKARNKPAPAAAKPATGSSPVNSTPVASVTGRPSIVTGRGPETSGETGAPAPGAAHLPSVPPGSSSGIAASSAVTPGATNADGKPARLEVPPRPGMSDRSGDQSGFNRPLPQGEQSQRPSPLPGVNLSSDAASSAASSSQAPAARPGQYTSTARPQPTLSQQDAYRSPANQEEPVKVNPPLRPRAESDAGSGPPVHPPYASPTIDRPHSTGRPESITATSNPSIVPSMNQPSVSEMRSVDSSLRHDPSSQRVQDGAEPTAFKRPAGLPERGQPPVPGSSTPLSRLAEGRNENTSSIPRPNSSDEGDDAAAIKTTLPPLQRPMPASSSFGQFRPAPKPVSESGEDIKEDDIDPDENGEEEFNQARPFSMSSENRASLPVKPEPVVSSPPLTPAAHATGERQGTPYHASAGGQSGNSVIRPPLTSPAQRTEPERVSEVAKVIRPGSSGPVKWDLPQMSLLQPSVMKTMSDKDLKFKASVIEQTLSSFGAPGRVVEVNCGPVITQFGVEPDYLDGRAGKKIKVKVGKIAALADDLALVLAAPTIRIEAPVPGKGYVGIEVPNDTPSIVGLRDAMDTKEFKALESPLKLALGHDVSGQPRVADLTKMPHLLIAGTTGSGKSVCVNGIICTMLMENTPDRLKMIMVDPKRVELTGYNGIPHLLTPVVTELERILSVLKWLQREMEERYHRFALVGARNIVDFNQRITDGRVNEDEMPYYLVIIDELADLMMQAPDETERLLTRLAQMARATGIHLIISTQRPSVDVVTGVIKANFPARIAFAVATGVDSRVIIDMPGAEKLLGSGDMLFQAPDAPLPIRLQGVYTSDKEIEQIVNYWREQAAQKGQQSQTRSLEQLLKSAPEGFTPPVATSGMKQSSLFNSPDEGEGDDLFDEAVDLVRDIGKASTSLLQRHMRIGYTRAARLIDLMEEKKVIGPHEGGSKPRIVFDEEGNVIEGSDIL